MYFYFKRKHSEVYNPFNVGNLRTDRDLKARRLQTSYGSTIAAIRASAGILIQFHSRKSSRFIDFFNGL